MKNNNLLIFAIFLFLGPTFSSCKKDKKENPEPEVETGSGYLRFHLHTYVDQNEIDAYNVVYTTDLGRKVSVSIAQLYISGIQLIKLDGSTYDIPGTIVLKKSDLDVYTIGTVPAGNYRSIKFNVGLNPSINASTPAAADSTLNQPAMWFGTTAQPSGFVFVNFQGKIDTTADATGTTSQMQPFSYRIGTNANLKTVTMPDQNYTVSPDQVQYQHILVDLTKLFSGIALNVNSNLIMNDSTANSTPLGIKLANNIPSMFKYE